MDMKKFCSGYFIVMFLLVFNCGIFAFDEDYPDEDTQNVRCPWIRNKLKNGRVKIRSRGRIAKFLCDPGYELAGKRFATCVRGQWNNPIPVCVAKGCPRKSSIANGKVTEMYRGAMLVYDCNPGYILDSDASIYCDGRRWNRNPPKCVVTTSDPATACDFEDPDLCGWSHDPTHDFDWKRNQFSTPSGHVGTGPSYDHTFGIGKGGFYLYLEASSPRKTNDTSRLFSPVYPSGYSGGCFVFWYHMYGETTGGLRVYLKPESHVFGELSPVWEKFGAQGNQWLQGRITIPQLNENFQLIIEGIRGSSYVGDSAIDDVRLAKSDCESMENATETVAKTDADSCRGRCREAVEDNECGCNENCHATESCCSDYMMICPPGNDSSIENTDESLPIDELGKSPSPVTVTIAKLTSTESFETTPTMLTKHAISKSTANKKSGATAVVNPSTKMLTAFTSTAPTTKTTSTMTRSIGTMSSFHDEIPLSSLKKEPTTKITSVSTPEPTTASTTQLSSSTMQLTSPIAPAISTTVQSTSSTTQSTSSTTQSISSTMQSSTTSTIKPSTASTALSTTELSTTSINVSTKQSESSSVPTAISNVITQKSSVSTTISSTSSVEDISADKSTLQTAIPVEILTSNTKSDAIRSSPFSTSIATTSSTRKTYNLRPRTRKTTSFTQISTPSTSSNPPTSTSTTFANAIKTAVTRSSFGTVTERTSSRSPYVVPVYSYRPRPPTPRSTVNIFPLSSTTRSTVKIFPLSSTTRSTVKIFPLGSTPRSTVKIFPLTNKMQTNGQTAAMTTVSPSISTTRHFLFSTPTQAALRISQGSESITTHASTIDTSRHSPITVISISIVVILCVAGGLAYYMKKYRPKRRSKLAEDSEMLLI